MIIKPGKVYYYIGMEPDGKPTMETWIVRTVRGGKAYAIWKLSHTWGKRSKRNGDFGWIDPIPAWCRVKWPANEKPPIWFGLFTTKYDAIANAIRTAELDDFDTPEQMERHLAGLKRMRS